VTGARLPTSRNRFAARTTHAGRASFGVQTMFRYRLIVILCAAFCVPARTTPAQQRETVPEITDIQIHYLMSQPPGLAVIAEGQVSSGGHTDVRLDRVNMVTPPADGYQIYRLSSVPPSGPATTVISAVSASDAWPNFEAEAPWIRGVRVLGTGSDGAMEKRLNRRVRRNIRDLDADEIESLRRGIQAMKDRPDTDRTSWAFQANIHGTFTGSDPLFSQCQHGTIHFLSWHRLYLHHFEQILADAAGDPELTLPYWDWSEDRALPLPFRQPANAGNSLFDGSRAINAGELLPTSVVEDDLAQAMGRDTFGGFFGFSRSLEGSPHGAVHVLVGGNMSTVPLAANDPIFWLHHCNIDRLWDHWLNSSSIRQNPTDNAFLNQTFSFAAADGSVVTDRVGDHLYSSQLGYSYDTTPAPSVPLTLPAAPPAGMVAAAPQDNGSGDDHSEHADHHEESDMPIQGFRVVAKSATAAEIEVDAAPGQNERSLALQPHRVQLSAEPDTEIPFDSVAPVSSQKEKLLVEVVGLKFDQAPAVGYMVYLNLPPDVDSDERRKPYRLGVLNLFGTPQKKPSGEANPADHDHGASQVFDATKTIARLKNLGLWTGDGVEITMLPITATPPPGEKDAYESRLKEQADRANVRYDAIRLLAR